MQTERERGERGERERMNGDGSEFANVRLLT